MSPDPPKLPAPKSGLSIDDITVPTPPPNEPDYTEVVKAEALELENDRKRAEVESAFENIQARKEWGKKVFWLLIGWLLAVAATVVLQGFAVHHFHLSDSVLIAFIGTTTFNVLSLGYIVANYLFPKR